MAEREVVICAPHGKRADHRENDNDGKQTSHLGMVEILQGALLLDFRPIRRD